MKMVIQNHLSCWQRQCDKRNLHWRVHQTKTCSIYPKSPSKWWYYLLARPCVSTLCKIFIRNIRVFGVPFVPKEENPPGLPQLRHIEDFWATHKDLVYEGGWEAKNDKDLIKRINDKWKCFNQEYFANLMCKVKTKLRRAAEDGPDTLIH